MTTITIESNDPDKINEIVKALQGLPTTVTLTPQPQPAPAKETHVGIALDASGSMASIKDEIIGAFNATVDQLKADQDKLGTVFVTFVTFGEKGGAVIEKYRRQPLSKLERLSRKTYVPSGMTPFYDGLGRLLTAMEAADQPHDGVDRAFLVNVFTDGMENASREWSSPGKLKAYVERLQATGRWTVTYAGANVNLSQVSASLGIYLRNMWGFESSRVGTQLLTGQHVNSMSSYSAARSMGSTQSEAFYGNGETTPSTPPPPWTPTEQDAVAPNASGPLTAEQIERLKKSMGMNTKDGDEDDDNSLTP